MENIKSFARNYFEIGGVVFALIGFAGFVSKVTPFAFYQDNETTCGFLAIMFFGLGFLSLERTFLFTLIQIPLMTTRFAFKNIWIESFIFIFFAVILLFEAFGFHSMDKLNDVLVFLTKHLTSG